MKPIISTSVIILVAASAFFFWLWYEQYLRFEFNELGRYYDAENQIIYTDAGFVWCFPAVCFLLIAFIVSHRSYSSAHGSFNIQAGCLNLLLIKTLAPQMEYPP